MPSFTFPHCEFVMLSRNLVLFETQVSRATISLWPQQQTKASVVNVFECKAVKTVCSCSDESSVLEDDPNQTHTIHHSVHVSLSLCSHPSNGPRVAARQKMTFYYSAVSLYYSIVFVSISRTAAWQPGAHSIQCCSHSLHVPLL